MSIDRIAHAEQLYAVISLQLTPADAEAALRGGWDLELAVAVLTHRDLAVALNRFIEDSISAVYVAAWAEFLELRDDVDFDTELVKATIHELANPLLHGALTLERSAQLLEALAGPRSA